MKENALVWVVLLVLVSSMVMAIGPLEFTGFFISTESGEMNLTLWDNTHSKGGSFNVYADGSSQGSAPGSTTLARFYTNYTNLTSGEPINGSNIECNISINLSSGWTTPVHMWFNDSSMLYVYNYTFDSRGNYSWNATCFGSAQSFGTLGLLDNISITNTPAGIYVPLATKVCYEDTICTYEFSADCYDIDNVDSGNLTYGYKAGTDFTGFSLNTTSGNVTVNITDDSGCGEFSVTMIDKDSTGWGATADKAFTVNAVNDLPEFGSITTSANENETHYQDISATDEDNPSGPFFFNITILSCYRTFNTDHSNVTDCYNLFSFNTTSGEINTTRTFSNSDVGEYTINFTVTDAGNNLTNTSIPPYTWLSNKTQSSLLNFTVSDVNNRPEIVHPGNQTWVQNSTGILVINVTDVDNGTFVFNITTLYRNMSLYYNTSLFQIYSNETVYTENGTSFGNVTINMTPVGNHHVGNYTLNISVYDGRSGGTNSILVDVTVTNINDPPNMTFSCNNYSVQGLEYYCNVGDSTNDPDNFSSYVPYTDNVNGTVTYEINFTYCNKTFNATDTNCTIFGINNITGVINYTNPLRLDSGNYTINITATDGGNLTSSSVFNFTVIADYPPNMTSVAHQTAAQNESIYLVLNATDPDNATDTLTFRTETYYQGTLYNTSIFDIETNLSSWPPGPAYGIMNYTPIENSHVGNYTVKIIVNDTWGREDYILVDFNISNINDPPVINFSCPTSVNEDTEYFCNVSENTTDVDTLTPMGDNLTYTMNFTTGTEYFSINQTTGIINFTASNDTWANNNLNFTYNLTTCVYDVNGSMDCENHSITIHAVNDAPQFSFTNTSITANSTFFENVSAGVTDEESNTPYTYNLTFVNCSKDNTSDTNCTVFSINQTTGVVNFYALEKDTGNYTLNITVTDKGNTTQPYNATSSKLVDFNIYTLNHPPYVNIAGTVEGDTVSENSTLTFLITVSDSDGHDLQCTWYRNTTIIGTVSSCQDEISWQYVPGFDESGVWDFKLSATDSYSTSSTTMQITIENTNRAPTLSYPIQNQSWNMNTANSNIILSYNFQDPDNENNVTNDDNNLTLNYTVPSNVAVLIDGQTGSRILNATQWSGSGTVTLTPTTDWYGLDYIMFTVSDSEYNATSNNITLNVSYTDTPTETVVQQTYSSGGSSGTESKIASLTITTSQLKMIGSNNETTAEILLKNTGEVSLNAINITSYVKESDEISLELSRTYISQLSTGANETTNLTIRTSELTQDTYAIEITGDVNNPSFNQSTVIYLRPIYGATKVLERINLAKDLFQDNPECIELTELIIQAEKRLSENNLQEAQSLTETALENCRDIIEYVNSTKRRVTPDIIPLPINEIIIVLLSIALGTVLVYIWMDSRAGRKKK